MAVHDSASHVNSLKRVAQKVLVVIAKYKDKQLPPFDELRVLDGMSQGLTSYKNLFDDTCRLLLHCSAQWTIYWKWNVVAGADLSFLSWWENGSLYMGMPDLADCAVTALTLPVTKPPSNQHGQTIRTQVLAAYPIMRWLCGLQSVSTKELLGLEQNLRCQECGM
mmetsp:Transcript_99874/g.168567  ORF Transcript_99874/g.168567 Transcript_99874/m.168567 type:complete len:165 (+) Transcript_99874:112-606(+)